MDGLQHRPAHPRLVKIGVGGKNQDISQAPAVDPNLSCRGLTFRRQINSGAQGKMKVGWCWIQGKKCTNLNGWPNWPHGWARTLA